MITNFDFVPDRCCIGIATNTGVVRPLEIGTLMYLIEDPRDVSKIVAVVLEDVGRGKIVFRCACGKPGCTRRIAMKGLWKGTHPSNEYVTPKLKSGTGAPNVPNAPSQPMGDLARRFLERQTKEK